MNTQKSIQRNIPDQLYEKRKFFFEEVKHLDKEEYHEIFRIIKKHSVEYTENNNGVFFDLNRINDETFQKLDEFMNYCKTQRSNEKQRNEEIKTFRSQTS